MKQVLRSTIKNWMTIISFLLFGILVISCKQQNTNADSEKVAVEETQVDLPPAFNDFYERFHTDSVFQLEHILFPLPEQQSGDSWTKEEWKIHGNPLLNTKDIERQIRNINGLIIEVVYHKMGFYLVERRFMQADDTSWDMIYYAERTNLDDWEREYENSNIDVSPVRKE